MPEGEAPIWFPHYATDHGDSYGYNERAENNMNDFRNRHKNPWYRGTTNLVPRHLLPRPPQTERASKSCCSSCATSSDAGCSSTKSASWLTTRAQTAPAPFSSSSFETVTSAPRSFDDAYSIPTSTVTSSSRFFTPAAPPNLFATRSDPGSSSRAVPQAFIPGATPGTSVNVMEYGGVASSIPMTTNLVTHGQDPRTFRHLKPVHVAPAFRRTEAPSPPGTLHPLYHDKQYHATHDSKYSNGVRFLPDGSHVLPSVPDPKFNATQYCGKDSISRRLPESERLRYHIPGYQGFVRSIQFRHGETFGRTTRKSVADAPY